jgi:hypothetical protein
MNQQNEKDNGTDCKAEKLVEVMNCTLDNEYLERQKRKIEKKCPECGGDGE